MPVAIRANTRQYHPTSLRVQEYPIRMPAHPFISRESAPRRLWLTYGPSVGSFYRWQRMRRLASPRLNNQLHSSVGGRCFPDMSYRIKARHRQVRICADDRQCPQRSHIQTIALQDRGSVHEGRWLIFQQGRSSTSVLTSRVLEYSGDRSHEDRIMVHKLSCGIDCQK